MSWNEVIVLVEQAQAGDKRAFDEIYTRFRGLVFAKALKTMRDDHLAEELTQDVFMHAFRKIGQLQNPRCLAGWLRRMTARMGMNRFGKVRAASGLDAEVLDNHPGHVAEAGEEMESHEDALQVREAIHRLKPLDRQVLEAHYLQGQSIETMSARFDAPEGTIKRRLHTARHRLKALLPPEYAAAAF